MNFEMTEEHKMIRGAARDFAQTELLQGVIERDEKQLFPSEQIKKLGELGFLGMMVDSKYGGAGMDAISYVFAMEEISKVDASCSVVMSVNNSLVCWGLETFGTEEQKETYLRPLATGEIIGAFCLSEPEAGSDATSQQTTAIDKGDHYLLNGTKNWVTNGNTASVYLVIAQTDVEKAHRGINVLIVEKGMEGFTSSDIHGKLSLRASVTSELSMANVRVPDSARLPNIEGLKGPLSCLTQARYGIAWGMVGAAVDCYNTAVDYSKERKQFSKPIAGFQLTQAKLAEMVTCITEAQLLVYRLGRLKDEGKMTFQQVSMAKRNNCAMARDIARTSREILGANGITEDYSPLRHMANIESVYTYEGTHEMHSLILGQEVTGMAAYDT